MPVQSLGGEDPLEEEIATHSNVSLHEKSHEQRNLAGYSQWSHKGSDATEHSQCTLKRNRALICKGSSYILITHHIFF